MEYKIVNRRWVIDEPKGWFGQMETGHIEETMCTGDGMDILPLGRGTWAFRNPIKDGEEFLERMYTQGWELVSVIGYPRESTYIFRTLYHRPADTK